MLRRCLKGSARLIAAAEKAHETNAPSQICNLSHARGLGGEAWSSQSSLKLPHLTERGPSGVGRLASAGAAATSQAWAQRLEGQQHFLCLSSSVAACSSLTSSVARQSGPAHSQHHRTCHETPAIWQSRSFAKARRLVQPASRATRKAEERLPPSRRAVADVDASSKQADVPEQKDSSENAVVTQAEESRATDVQVRFEDLM